MFLGYDNNMYGTKVSVHVCDTCGEKFTVCPAVGERPGWDNCATPECGSYDPYRDVDKLFGKDDKILPGVKIEFAPIIRPVG